MSHDCSPKRLPVRVHSTFEMAIPITEMPPDRDAIAVSPETAQRKLSAVEDVLANAKCEEGTSMDDIATYIPPKSVRKQVEAATLAYNTAKAANEAKIAAMEAELAQAKQKWAAEEEATVRELELLSITRPTSVLAHGMALSSATTTGVVTGVVGAQSPISPARGSLSSTSNTVFVTPPAIGALVAAPPAMGALMGAPPAIGALVVAALQPAAQPVSPPATEEEHYGDDFQLIHNEYKQALATEKTHKKTH